MLVEYGAWECQTGAYLSKQVLICINSSQISREYGCVVWATKWEEGERVQREIGRRILRCRSKTTNEAVLGELGWWRLRTRRDFVKLKYWIQILLMKGTRLVKRVYHESKCLYMTRGKKNWCKSIYKLVCKYNLNDLWKDEKLVSTPNPRMLSPINSKPTQSQFK